jgi:tRNA threonylcarbamoyladenosine biosynthesis protein TsaB
MALILSLETATKTCSVALGKDGAMLAKKELTSEQFSHAEKLTLFIEDVFVEASHKIEELDAVAISAGPGSYTGLRIGTSTAKGICYALDIPLIGINSLKATAALSNFQDGLICPMFDARRMEVYAAVYSAQLEEIAETNAIVIDEHSFEEYLEESKVLFLGPGAEKCQSVITSTNAMFDLETKVSAQGMIRLAEYKFQSADFEDLAYFEPKYLKDFVAGTPKKLL